MNAGPTSFQLSGFAWAAAWFCGCLSAPAIDPLVTEEFANLARHRVGDEALAVRYFREADELCRADDGKLWGVSLAGPLMFVDPQSRTVYANQADPEGALRASDGCFVGQLPAAIPVANYSLRWSGVHWTMVMWPLPEEDNPRRVLVMHESFHRIQNDVGFPVTGPDNAHLDTLEGRYWLQLEWRALEQALRKEHGARRLAVHDALVFRTHRRNVFQNCTDSERQLEMHEGLAEYTGVVLSGMSPRDREQYVADRLETRPRQYPSFTRSFAYLSGPAYGLLLDQAEPGWNQKAAPSDDLGELLRSAVALDPVEVDETSVRQLASKYDPDGLWDVETERDAARQRRQAVLREKFVDGPTFEIPLEKIQFSFDPGAVEPIAGAGTYFEKAQVTDRWGTLQVTDGILRDDGFGWVRVTPPRDPNAQPPKGDGWELELAPGWRVVPGEREGDYRLEKIPAGLDPQPILEADRAFAKAAAERGLDGWMSFIAEDAAKAPRPGDKIASGKEEVREIDAEIFANPNRKLIWAPGSGHLFANGQTGVTSGRYQLVATGDDGQPSIVAEGGYVTFWRKEPDGQWKVIFDTGCPDAN